MEYNSNNLFGMVQVNKKESSSALFSFENGKITFHIGRGTISLPEGGLQDLIACDSQNNHFLFHLPYILNDTLWKEYDDGKLISQLYGNYSVDVEYYVDNYREDVKYNQMVFRFPEFDYFLPSASAVVRQDDSFVFEAKENIFFEQKYIYEEKKITIKLRNYGIINKGLEFQMNSVSELVIDFEETQEIHFLYDLFKVIHSLFSFICGRKNIALDCALLKGKYLVPEHMFGEEKIEARIVPHTSNLFVIDKFGEPFEEEKTIKKTIRFDSLASGFGKLVEFVLMGKISTQCIHSSRKKRNLIDLAQSLSITSAFEFYVREWGLPSMFSETRKKAYKEAIEEVTLLFDKATGKKKDIYKGILHDLDIAAPSLMDKVKKICYGYKDENDEWKSLKGILPNGFDSKIDVLAKEANDWRNELAHEKRTYELKAETLEAIRLVEYLNYCIVLRKTGFVDDEISRILAEILY